MPTPKLKRENQQKTKIVKEKRKSGPTISAWAPKLEE